MQSEKGNCSDNKSICSGSSGFLTGAASSTPNEKDSWSGWRSRRTLSEESGRSVQSLRSTSQVDQSVARLLNQLSGDVRKFPWELRREIAKLLNPLKEPVGNDWRLVASRLGYSVADIRSMGGKENPTMELLDLCTNTTSENLVQTIVEIGRVDVINDLLDVLRLNDGAAYKVPTQESLDDSASSGFSFPLDESFNTSGSDRSRLSKTPSENKEDEDIIDDIERFITEESRQFWHGIPGQYFCKRWKLFFEAMERACPEEIQKSNVAKVLCHVLKIIYDERDSQEVTMQAFCRLVAWFGPMQPGKEGTLHKIREIITNSISKDINGKQSWFAGHMNETQAGELLRDLTPGHFLVRFSSSRADDGFFVLAVKTQDSGVVQIQIEASPKEGLLYLGGQHFTSLLEIVTRLRREVLLDECRQLLINPCPSLPLNAMFSGYCHGGPKRRGMGRGRIPRGGASAH